MGRGAEQECFGGRENPGGSVEKGKVELGEGGLNAGKRRRGRPV